LTVVNAYEDVVARFAMEPIPAEGGWFHRTWAGPADDSGRPVGSAILALFADAPDGMSRFHRLDAAETWTWIAGAPLRLVRLHASGTSDVVMLGPITDLTFVPQVTVEPGTWMGAAAAAATWALVSCTMAPGFAAQGFELGVRSTLLAGWPDRAPDITRLT
jgi:uncharacterized protein